MISICTCGINCAYDLKVFVEFTVLHNSDCEYEICLTWDNRFKDLTGKTVDNLLKRYSNFKVIENTKDQTVTYLEKLLTYYEKNNFFEKDFRDNLSKNLDLYKINKLLDESCQSLWLSSGYLYNKAVSISNGNNLIITPCDYVYLYKLSTVNEYINSHIADGEFYGKPNALVFHLGNKVEKGRAYKDPNFSLELKDSFLFDEKTTDKLFLEDTSFFTKVSSFIERGVSRKEFFYNYHGQHFITKKLFNKIGGFTEEWFGRAWADDKMSALACFDFRHSWKELPPKFAFPLTDVTLYSAKSVYLHNGFDQKYINKLATIFDKVFASNNGKTSGRLSPPIKM